MFLQEFQQIVYGLTSWWDLFGNCRCKKTFRYKEQKDNTPANARHSIIKAVV